MANHLGAAELVGAPRSETVCMNGQLTMRLSVSAELVRHARRIVVEHALMWDLEELSEDLGLTVSELLTSVLVHVRRGDGAPRAELLVQRTLDGAVVVVHDDDPTVPQEQPSDACDEGGRGFRVIRGLGAKLAITPSPQGKDIAAVFRRPLAAAGQGSTS
ncbi:ATP-binding protein [Streptomyces sp. NPDC002669]|uniref:ATP-binding protein n=1 Tax=Streptomyces sp. NPDC002669 TaxID=3364658 RepID=UPI003697D8B2